MYGYIMDSYTSIGGYGYSIHVYTYMYKNVSPQGYIGSTIYGTSIMNFWILNEFDLFCKNRNT